MGMLLYMEEMKRKEAAEKARKEAENAVETVSEPPVEEESTKPTKAVKRANKPVKRTAPKRAK